MDAQRNRLGERLSEALGLGQPLLVHAVAGFVRAAGKGVAPAVGAVPVGDAAIAGAHSLAEWVGGSVHSTGVVIEAHRLGDPGGELDLLVDREFADRRVHAGGLARGFGVHDLLNQRHGELAQRAEDLLRALGGHAGFKRVHERVVELAALGNAEALGLAPVEFEGLLKPGEELREIVLRAGVLPGPHAHRGASREFLDERLGQFRGEVIVPADLAEVGLRDGVVGDRAVILGFAEEIAELRVGVSVVVHAAEQRELVGAEGGALLGHHGLLVP